MIITSVREYVLVYGPLVDQAAFMFRMNTSLTSQPRRWHNCSRFWIDIIWDVHLLDCRTVDFTQSVPCGGRIGGGLCTDGDQVQGWVGGARHGGHGVGDHRAVRAGGAEGQAQGPRARLQQLLHRAQLRGLRRRAQPRLQRHLLRLPRRLPLRRPLLLLPRRPPLPAQRHQLPHLRPQPRRLLPPRLPLLLRRGRSPRATDAAAARPPDAPLLRRQPQGHLRRRGVPQDTARRLGRRGRRRRHPRLRHQPHGAGQAGLPRRGGRAQQGARRAAAGHHGPVRVLLQLDVAVGQGRRRRRAEDGRALRRGGAAGAPGEELRDRRGARRQVHRPAGGPLARDLRHREHPAAGAPVGVRHQEPTTKIPAVAVHALILIVRPTSNHVLCFFSLWWWPR
ncbi:uncharacterized protein LOC119276774 isoform X2 [Triticum dicoccoides]|uniref:uncharacterized protein LOC119276774 isoform X2 n=1 Tax=Triticum dicoccoides TaxID=85692 RepID=UPI00188F9B00|nr:uncharacterized protein LOC119276774 isoform X2 [Triticum dicoccoides]